MNPFRRSSPSSCPFPIAFHLAAALALGLAATACSLVRPAPRDAVPDRPIQYIVPVRSPGQYWNQALPEKWDRAGFMEIKNRIPVPDDARIRLGVGFIFSYLRSDPETTAESLRLFLKYAEETDTPVVVHLDGEHWWEARPDLWNWWDPSKPGYDPKNRMNVEWTSWSPDDAVKICWRNWGSQLRVLPQPNLMSPAYLDACRAEMRRVVPIIVEWWKNLPEEKKDLLIAVKVGHESSIGANAWYYPNGNDLLDKPAEDDPKTGLVVADPLSRGVAQIGYAAVKTAGIRARGDIEEADLAEVARRYLEFLAKEARDLGVPRDRLFSHGVGWKQGELLYDAPVNEYSCPSWSFYDNALDPGKDIGAQRNVERSDAPYWAAAEWLYWGSWERKPWKQALRNTLADPRSRFVCIFNWEGIHDKPDVVRAIEEVIAESAE